jgi:hypothetical protein
MTKSTPNPFETFREFYEEYKANGKTWTPEMESRAVAYRAEIKRKLRKPAKIAAASLGGILLLSIAASLYNWSLYEPYFAKHVNSLTTSQAPRNRAQAEIYMKAANIFLSGEWKEHTSEYQANKIISNRDQAQALISKLDAEAAARESSVKAEEERKANEAKWGPFFAGFDNQQQAKKICNDYAFRMTEQTRSWIYDDRTDFEIRAEGDRIWVGGPITVKIKGGNLDGSTREFQRNVDCYWSRNATSLEGGQISVN